MSTETLPSGVTDPSVTPDGPAPLRCGGMTWHGHALDADACERWVGCLTGLLAEHGVTASSRVMLVGSSDGYFCGTLFALMNTGATVVLVDEDQVERVATDPAARPDVLVRTGRTRSPDPGVREVGIHAELRAVRNLDTDTGLQRLERPVDLRPWFAKDECVVLPTSGTTGEPQVVSRSGQAMLANLRETAELFGYRTDDAFMPLLPLSHQYGLSIVLLSLVAGTRLVLVSHRRLSEVGRTARAAGVTSIDATPTLYARLLEHLRRTPALVSSFDAVRLWGVGGEPLPPRLATEFRAVFGRPLLDGYGSTQFGNIALTTPEDALRGAAAALTPLPTWALRVVDDSGRDLAGGEPGRLVVGCPRDLTPWPAGRAAAPVAEFAATGEQTVWFETGDIGLLRESRLTVLGRRDGIHRNGFTIHLAVLERRLADQGIASAFMQDASGRVIAFVVDPLRRERAHWSAALRAHLLAHEQPDVLHVVPTLPETATGKTDRRHLRQLSAATPEKAPASGAHGAATVRWSDPTSVMQLAAVADHVRTHRERVVDALTTIEPRVTAEAEVDLVLRALDGAEAEVAATMPSRLAAVGAFLPRNLVLLSYTLYGLVPLLYADRVWARPAVSTSAILRELHVELAHHVDHRLTLSQEPHAAFTSAMSTTAELVVFTGRYEHALEVSRQLSRATAFVYFGAGYNPFVVARGADVGQAARDAVRARLFNSGQDCLAPDVFFVERAVVDAFLTEMDHALDDVRCGLLDDALVAVGPLADPAGFGAACRHIAEHAAYVVRGGGAQTRHRLLEPTVLVRDHAPGWSPPEHFAPIFEVRVVDLLEEALAELTSANYTENALGVSLYGVDEDAVRSLTPTYLVGFNRPLVDLENPNAPFGGGGRRSGFVRCRDRIAAGPILLSQVAAELGRAGGGR